MDQDEADRLPALPGPPFERLIEHMREPCYTLDSNWRFTYLNPQASVLLQRSRADLLHRNVWEVFPEAVNTSFHSVVHRAVSDGATIDFEGHYPPLAGWFAVRSYPFPGGLAVFFQDVTAEKVAEDRLRVHALMLDAVEQPIIEITASGVIQFCNRVAAALFGWPAEEAVGRRLIELLEPFMSNEEAARIWSRLGRGEVWTGELGVERGNDTALPVYITNAPIFDDDGSLAGIVGASTDIMQRRRQANAARQLLTRRERDVLWLIGHGLSNREIAAELGIGVGTVKTHVEHILAKLQVTDRAKAAVRAVEWRLLDAPET